MRLTRSTLVLTILLTVAGLLVGSTVFTVQAQDPAPAIKPPANETGPEPTIQRFDLTITPVAPPQPLLKYELLPPMRNRKPGNRAPYYLRAIIHWEASLPQEVQESFMDVYRRNDASLDEFSAEEIRQLLKSSAPIIRQLELGAGRDVCEWNLHVESLEGWEAISFSLEEFQRTRLLAFLLRLKGRLEVVDGRFDDAIQTLQIGYQLARDVSKPPTVINSLIGIAITTIISSVVVDWIEQHDAPNLYWALATRPQPLTSIRRQFHFEASLPERMFPVLRDPEAAVRPDSEWDRLIRELVIDLENIDNYWKEGRSAPTDEALEAADRVIAEALPIARRELRAAGFDENRLDAMPAGQILAIHTSRFSREQFDRLVTLLDVSPPQVDRIADAFEEEYRQVRASTSTGHRRESLPVFERLQSSLRQALLAWHRTQQRMDGLQCLEAIRAYAATHADQFPDSLDEITDTPCPLNVQTGEAFAYERTKNSAVLTIPSYPAHLPQTGREYTLRIEQSSSGVRQSPDTSKDKSTEPNPEAP